LGGGGKLSKLGKGGVQKQRKKKKKKQKMVRREGLKGKWKSSKWAKKKEARVTPKKKSGLGLWGNKRSGKRGVPNGKKRSSKNKGAIFLMGGGGEPKPSTVDPCQKKRGDVE